MCSQNSNYDHRSLNLAGHRPLRFLQPARLAKRRYGKEYKQLATYKVADSPTHAYPVLSGNRIFIKDRDSLTLWIVD